MNCYGCDDCLAYVRRSIRWLGCLIPEKRRRASMASFIHPISRSISAWRSVCRDRGLFVFKGGGGEAERVPLKAATGWLWDRSLDESEIAFAGTARSFDAADLEPPKHRHCWPPFGAARQSRRPRSRPIIATIGLGSARVGLGCGPWRPPSGMRNDLARPVAGLTVSRAAGGGLGQCIGRRAPDMRFSQNPVQRVTEIADAMGLTGDPRMQC